MYSAAELIPLSALQHYLYCPRQCGLIHLEQIWVENAYTAEGRILHEKAHGGTTETRGDCKTATGLPLRSLTLGLSGQADVVEFHRRENVWHPFPVEYKRGRAKKHDADRVQLCAQALCLEEMLGVPVPEGALFYGASRRRQNVIFDDALRESTRNTAEGVHALIRKGTTPPPPHDTARCAACSLQEQCFPLIAKSKASDYLRKILESI